MSEDTSFTVDKWNVANSSQRNDAVMIIYHRLVKPAYAFADSLAMFFYQLCVWPMRCKNYDNRWKEAKEYNLALEKALAAIQEFDNARAALDARIKENRK